MVKLKIGNLEYEIVRFSHRFYFNNDDDADQIYVELKTFSDSLIQEISEAFEGAGQIISDNVTYNFENYRLDSIDYSLDDKSERTSIYFKK